MIILGILYIVGGYWAYGVMHENKVEFYTENELSHQLRKFLTVFLFGWAYIPLAVIRRIFHHG